MALFSQTSQVSRNQRSRPLTFNRLVAMITMTTTTTTMMIMWTFLTVAKQDMMKQRALLLQAATSVVHPPNKKYSRLQARVFNAIYG